MRLARHLALATAAVLTACPRGAPRDIVATGTLQVDEVDIGPIAPSRVVRVYVEEGDSVFPGDTLATLTQATLAPDLAIREARLQSAQAQLLELERGTRPAELQRARAQLEAAEAEAERTAVELQRAKKLIAASNISQQQLDNAQAAATTAAASRDAAAATLRLLQEGARTEQIQAARAEVASARGAVAAVEASVAELVLIATVPGVVSGRHVQPGEVVAAGQAAVTIARAQRPWARVYVGERMLPYVHAGQQVEGALDGVDGATFHGTIDHINTSAEFTPRVALTEEERADLVFGVKIFFAPDSTGLLKAGLPITVTIPVSPGATP
ncbi:MAG TPA: efflux RND transporter periplasmic adaptor subunit [Gemmatimonadales bacterium]|nr:efflux RND transporter periplasmic adaptor subunit [Gemmatimonadales bacterium]